MAKAAKKKDEGLKGTQKKHNKATRWSRSRRRGAVWARRDAIDQNDEKYTYEVLVPWNQGWDFTMAYRKGHELKEPFDALSLDWPEQLAYYSAEMGAKIKGRELDNGGWEYIVHSGGTILLTIQSAEKKNFRPKRRKRANHGVRN